MSDPNLPMTPNVDAKAVVDAITSALPGWEYLSYGDGDTRDHIWRAPVGTLGGNGGERNTIRPERVTYFARLVEHYRPGSANASNSLRPETADEAVVWLRWLGLSTPTQEQVAAAVLLPDMEVSSR